jgi:hypothetical protein
MLILHKFCITVINLTPHNELIQSIIKSNENAEKKIN